MKSVPCIPAIPVFILPWFFDSFWFFSPPTSNTPFSMNAALVSGHPRDLYIFWEGKEPKLIRLLRFLMYKHSDNGNHYRIHWLNNSNLDQYLPVVHPRFPELVLAHQADYIRVNVLYERGGVWMDSDTLVMDNLSSVFRMMDESLGFLVQEGRFLWNGVFGTRAKTQMMFQWKEEIVKRLDRGPLSGDIGWTDLGIMILKELRRSGLTKGYKLLGGGDVYPVKAKHCLISYMYRNWSDGIRRPWQPFLVLVGEVYRAAENWTMADLLQGSNASLPFFLRQSIQNVRDSGIQVTDDEMLRLSG
jgi:hypothetical protein